MPNKSLLIGDLHGGLFIHYWKQILETVVSGEKANFSGVGERNIVLWIRIRSPRGPPMLFFSTWTAILLVQPTGRHRQTAFVFVDCLCFDWVIYGVVVSSSFLD
ncbi:hypothetical protein JTE90_003959 [Oedothorax gibbosus]|uniref:Uncharacterized protein n=1 Tax=Oedothorax gibbosus TaxID=931172 RepID=A0AAV6UXZ4_9ARAC|nr:hypothetical protein JTE90_003959 [Oedothorax gibbosus]